MFWPFKRKRKEFLLFRFPALITEIKENKIRLTSCGVTHENGDALMMSGEGKDGEKYEMMTPQWVTLKAEVEWE